MIKFSSAFLFIVPSLLVLACNSPKHQNNGNPLAAGDVSTLEDSDPDVETELGDAEAAGSLYLDDMVDSADTGLDDNDKETDSVKDDLRGSKPKAAAIRMMNQLDVDDDDRLTKEEFIALLTSVGEKSQKLSAEKLAEAVARFEKSFDKAKGSDGMLNLSELKTVVKPHGKRVGKYRDCKKEKNQRERVKKVCDDILKKYDKNGNGKLDKGEQKELHDDTKKDCKSKNKKKKEAEKEKDKDKEKCKVVVGKSLTKGTDDGDCVDTNTPPEVITIPASEPTGTPVPTTNTKD